MSTLLLRFLFIAVLAYIPVFAFGSSRDDLAPLDAPYKHLVHPRVDFHSLADVTAPRPKSDVLAVLKQQTPVKSQDARGSCSIFSATALLEAMLVIGGKADTSLDLSEEWLQYLIAQWATNDGSNSPSNFRSIHERGMPVEAKLPYIGRTWTSLGDGDAQNRCARSKRRANCLTGHRDPQLLLMTDAELTVDADFLAARNDAVEFKKRFLTEEGSAVSPYLSTNTEIQSLLDKGIPLTLDISFYYGAWNHRLAPELGINRDLGNWAKGIVGYPEPGSVDAARSYEKPAGHSVVIIGYDTEREVEYTVKMTDGSTKTFKRKGVYYLKNSWGTTMFGADFELDGVKAPGYGMITMDYAHERGTFFRLAL